MRGRKADPPAVKRAKGNPGRRPIVDEPAAPREAAKPGGMPEFLDTRRSIAKKSKGRARAEKVNGLADTIWSTVEPELVAMGLIRKVDRTMLGLCCRYLAEWVYCTIELDRDGFWYETSSAHVENIKRPHPSVKIRREAWLSLNQLAPDMGLTPGGRMRLIAAMADRLQMPALIDRPEVKEMGQIESPVGLLN